MAMPILYRDDRLAAFAKPSGLLVHRGWDRDDVVCMDLAREALDAFVHPLHRLDRGTSGVLLFALDPEAAAAMGALFEAGAIDKTYVALVRGTPPAEGRVDHPIPRKEGGERVPSATTFVRLEAATVEELGRSFSLVEAHPETGRLHQVRRHLKHINHPILGDANYGKGDLNRLVRDRFGLGRLALHASRVAFTHPFSGERVTLSAELPEDLTTPLRAMGFRA